MCRAPLVLVLAVTFAAGGCGLLRPKKTPDQRFGTVVLPESSEDPDVLTVLPADSSRAYFYTDAVVTSVNARVETPERGGAAPRTDSARVEVLVRGSFPDACYELSGVAQNRIARLIDVTLTARRPQGAFCATVVRPYRFYLLLDGLYAPGPYTLTVNGTVAPFEVRL